MTITRTDNTRGHPRWNASYIYDAVDGAERFHMNEGQGDQSCAVTLIGNGKPCIVLNADDGESYIIDPDRGGGCCRYPTHLPRFRSNFLELEGATFNGYANVTVEFKQNRALLFDSHLFHVSGRGCRGFKDGLKNRRINLTFLFGLKGEPCRAG